MALLNLHIISPIKEIFSGEVSQAIFPGAAGSFAVLTRHAPLISTLCNGVLWYQSGNEWTRMEIDGGFVEVKDDTIIVCIEGMPRNITKNLNRYETGNK